MLQPAEETDLSSRVSDSDPQVRSAPRWFAPCLTAVIALAAVLRFNGLHQDSYWLDELTTVRFAQSEDLAEVISRTERDVHPPLYYSLCWALVQIGGDPERLLRVFSATVGTLTVLALGLVLNALAGPIAGLGAASLLAINGFHIYMSGEARSYALLTLLSVGSFGTLLIQLCRPPRRSVLACHIVSSSALLYTHYFGSILLACQAAALLLLSTRLRRRVILRARGGIAISGLLYLPWWNAQLRDMGNPPSWMPKPDGNSVLELMTVWWTPQPLAALLTGVLLLLGVTSARRKHASVPLVAIVLWALGPPILAYIKSQTGASIWMPRNLIVSLPGWIVLMSLGLQSIRLNIQRWLLLLVLAGASGWSLSRNEVPNFGPRGHVDLRGASAWLGRVNSLARFPVYFNQGAWTLGWYLDKARAPGWSGQDLPDRSDLLPTVLWLVEGHGALRAEQKQELDHRHQVLFSRNFAACRVSLYVPQDSELQFDRFTEMSLEVAPTFVRQTRAGSLAEWLGSRREQEALLLVSTGRFWRFLTLRERQVLGGLLQAKQDTTLGPSTGIALLIDPNGRMDARVALNATEPLDARLSWRERQVDVQIAGVARSGSRLARLRIANEELPLLSHGIVAARLRPTFGEVTELWGLDARDGNALRASFKRVSAWRSAP